MRGMIVGSLVFWGIGTVLALQGVGLQRGEGMIVWFFLMWFGERFEHYMTKEEK